jgi:hypothetical protein
MSRLARNISIVWRLEGLITRRRIAVVRNQSVLMIGAGISAGIALAAINVAAFFWLAETRPYAEAGLILALANAVLAILFAVLAHRMNADREVENATELRDLAFGEIENEVDAMAAEVRDLANSLRAIGKDPLGAALPGLATAVVGAVLKSRKNG